MSEIAQSIFHIFMPFPPRTFRSSHTCPVDGRWRAGPVEDQLAWPSSSNPEGRQERPKGKTMT